MSDRKISLQLTVSSSDSGSESDKCVVTNISNRTFYFSVELSFALERRKMFLPWMIRFQISMVVPRQRESEGPRQSTPKVRPNSVSLDLVAQSMPFCIHNGCLGFLLMGEVYVRINHQYIHLNNS